jgi:cell division protein ZapA (FtsZ GTPase activity inhibitor)
MTDKKNKTSVTIDDKEYFLEDMSEKAQRLLQHATDLDRKINNLVFQVEQMQLGRENVMSKLLEEVDLKEDE